VHSHPTATRAFTCLDQYTADCSRCCQAKPCRCHRRAGLLLSLMAQLGPLAPTTARRRSTAHSNLQEGYKIALQNDKYVEQDNICRADFNDPIVKQALGSVGLSRPFPVLVKEDGKMPNGQKPPKLYYCDHKGALCSPGRSDRGKPSRALTSQRSMQPQFFNAAMIWLVNLAGAMTGFGRSMGGSLSID
jgi:hypothetical protein